MIKETDILFLTNEHILGLTNEDPFKECFESISNKEVDSGHIQKLRDLQATLQTCLTSSSNKEILHSLMNLDIMKDLVECTKEKYEECKINDKAPEELLDPIRKVLSEYISASTPIHYLLLCNLLMSLFMKENSLGPSFKNRTGTKEYQDFSDDMVEFLNILSPIDEISQLQELLLNYFSREGESVYKNTKGLTILLFLDQLLNLEISEFEIPKSAMIWKARYHMVHNQLLTSNTCFLQDNSIGLYRNFLETNTIENKNIAACLWIEFSNCLLTFFKYSKAEVALENARELIGIKMSLTGKFGRRTKYQTFDLPQLVLNVESETVEQFIHPEISPVENIINEDKSETMEGEGEGDLEEPKIAHRDVNLEEENILLEKVKLKEEEKATEISLLDQIYINQFAYNEIKSHANEYDLKYEKLNAYIEKVLEKSQNWLIFSMSLFLRSINEQDKYKTRERSMIQMQTLIDQFRDEEPTLGERFRYVFTNAYPLSWNLKRHLGLAYQSIGCFMSAFELFKELEFYEDAAQCLVVSGKITQSENYINEVIEKYGETPRILCLLGDMKRKDEYYEKAWEISGHKYAKAMRSLGMMKFQRGHLDESIECLKLALDINKLYPSVWFTLGCAYIKKELYEKAIYAFGNVVSYDESHGEAWSNIASSYMQLSKPKEAQSSLEHAAKVCRSNWKIWENLIMLYLDGNQFMRVVSSIKQLIRLNKTDRVNAPLMIKVSSCFVNKYIKGNEAESSIARHKKILYDLFEQILSISPKNTGILKVFCRLMQSMDPNEYDKILDLKLREIRSIQSANWQYEIEERNKVTKTIQELKDFMGDRFESNEEVKCFVKNTLEVIEQTKK